MEKTAELRLKQVLNNNPQQALILCGERPDLENFIALPASIEERELHIPSRWHKLLDVKAQNKKAYLLIEDLDKVSEEVQDKFLHLLKDRRAGNYRLPSNVQVVIPVADKQKVSAQIKALGLVWDIK